MAQIFPFQAIRPQKELAKRIAALPYDVYSRREARTAAKQDPLSFLNIDRPETQFPEETDMYVPFVYQKAHDLLWERVADGTFVKDKKACYYVYELTMNGRSQAGIAACAAVDDYLDGTIRKHESTREEKEQDRIRHVDACNAQTGPIFLAYRHNGRIHRHMEQAMQDEPIFDFVSEDGIRHRGWQIREDTEIRAIREEFEKIPAIYIADGHHRAASAVKVSQKRRAEAAKRGQKDGFHAYDAFLCVLFEDDELSIMDYNRVVRDLNGRTPQAFLQELAKKCKVRETGTDIPFRPKQKGTAGMYLAGTWYELIWEKGLVLPHPVDGLDVAVLQREILTPLLGIGDPRTDKRITFVGGIRGLGELKRIADESEGVAFSMYPTSMQELFEAADAGLLMPPKSTWFEPKLRSGLFIHSIAE